MPMYEYVCNNCGYIFYDIFSVDERHALDGHRCNNCDHGFVGLKISRSYVVSDTCDWQRSPVTGKYTDSKSQIMKEARRKGYIETCGSEILAQKPKEDPNDSDDAYERDVQIATEMVRAGTAPLSEYDRHVCKNINEQIKNKV